MHKIKYLWLIVCLSTASYYSLAEDFEFPKDSWIYYSQDRSFDASGLNLDISRMIRGGIGYGTNATLLLASGMRSLGSTDEVYNAPFCIERRRGVSPDDNYKLWTDKIEDLTPVSNIGEFDKNIRLLNLPLDVDGHASLASIEFNEGSVTNIVFFDSLRDEVIHYAQRYDENLVKAIMKFISNDDVTMPPHRVVHALYQGGGDSNGCGFYTLFTAMLAKRNPNLISHTEMPLYNEDHDHLIRASVALVSFMHDDIWKAKSFRFDDTKAKTKVHHMLETPDFNIAERIWPRWYKIIGSENNMELWIKYNDMTRAKWSELCDASIWYQAALELPRSHYETRFTISNVIMDLAKVMVGQEILAKFSLEHVQSFRDWLDEQGLQYDVKPQLFGKEEILKKELLIF